MSPGAPLPAPTRARRGLRVLLGVVGLGVAVGLVAWNNLFVPSLPADPVARAVANVAGVAVLVATARACGLSWTDLGLGRHTWGRGARWGGGAVAVAVTGYAVALAVPALRPLLEAPTVAASPTGALLLRALVLIPVGTVLCEELAFRGVLHALGHRVLSGRVALVAVAATFGAWHVAGALAAPASGFPAGTPGIVLTVAAVLAVTVGGGVALSWVRRRTGSLLAPIGLHLGTNVVGLVAVVVATR